MAFMGVINPSITAISFLRDQLIITGRFKAELRVGLENLKFDMLGMKDEFDKLRRMGESIRTEDEQAAQELAYDVENFVHKLAPEAYSFTKTLLGTNPGHEHVNCILSFRNKIKDLRERLKNIPTTEAANNTSGPSGSGESSEPEQLVGIDKPKEELRELLLSAAPAGEPHQLRVISIVGCSGLGKTALAKAVYDDGKVNKAFGNKAWVAASAECNKAEDLLKKILQDLEVRAAPSDVRQQECSKCQEVRPTPAAPSDVRQQEFSKCQKVRPTPAKELHKFLQNTTTRCLVVVDNMVKKEVWDDIQKAFPKDDKVSNRIIVTTSIEPIATSRSPGSYRHKMQGLNNEDSQKLFWREVSGSPPTPAMITDSASIFSKCDGSPLALVSVAKHVKQNRMEDKCKNVGQALGTYLADANADASNALSELKRSLVQCYKSLPDDYHRKCLLSVSMFTKGRRINSNSLTRRWIAEELVIGGPQRNVGDVASEHFAVFVDRSIIEPELISNNSKVKRLQAKGTILEFIVHRSISTANFVTLIHKNDRLPVTRGAYPVRRLSVHDGTEGSRSFANDGKTDLSVLRWLRICNSVPFNFSKCTLLRVLDLEDCKKLDYKVLASICKLVFLKYLSLRGSDVKEIPKEITELVNLQTLDIRGTQVKELPMKVIMMRELVHLFGRFELLCKPKGDKEDQGLVKEFFSEKSKLQTLAGVVTDEEDQGFKEIMLHAKKLKKVKIWCKTDSRSLMLIPPERFTGSKYLESLSVNSSDQPINFLSDGFLDSLESSCAISSLKLWGVLGSLPGTLDSFSKLDRLSELQLSSTDLDSDDLSVLQKISCLLYLKLAEDRLDFGNGRFVVEEDGFPSLRRLCIEAPGLPKVQLKKGAMPGLTSLELLIGPRTPLQTEETSEITSHQPEAPSEISSAQTRATAEIERHLEEDELPSLKRLCIEAPGLPKVQLKKGAMPPLTSLQTGATSEISSAQPEAPPQRGEPAEIESRLGVEGVSHLANLNEVILHHDAPDATTEAWKEAAKRHINRPYVKKHPNPNSDTA